MSEGTSSLREFVPLGKLGEGTFSSVYKVKRLNDQSVYALKKIKIASLKQKQKANALNQIRILASLHSPHIITYKEAFFDEKLQLLCIVMELASEGDLLVNIKSHQQRKQFYPEAQVWKAAMHTTRGLATLHRHAILHRDLKSANIFLAQGRYKLGDLNVSKVNDHQNRLVHTQTGTPFYASPEIWRDQPYGSPSDVWSLGCILYEMCCLRPPFQGKDLDQLYRSVQRGYTEPLPKMYSQQLNKLIQNCLQQNPRDRPSAEELLAPNSLIMINCKNHGINTNEVQDNPYEQQQLLRTIKMPNDLKKLNSQLPSAKYQSEQDQVTLRPKTAQPKQKTQKTTTVEQEREEKVSLPQRIKNHLSSIQRTSSQQLPHRRIPQHQYPKSKITSSLAQPSSKPLEDYLTPPKNILKQKQRPLSCNQLRPTGARQIPEERPPYYLQKLNKGPNVGLPKPTYLSDRKPIELRSYKNKINMLSDRKEPYSGGSKFMTQSQDPYMIQRQSKAQADKMRCRSANIVPSAYSQIRQRLQARHRYLNPSLHRVPLQKSGASSKLRSQVRSEASIERAQLVSHSYVLPSSLSAQRHRPALAERIRQPETSSYLQQIQHKILSSANPKARKCDPLLGGSSRPYLEGGSQIRRQIKGQNVFGRAHRV